MKDSIQKDSTDKPLNKHKKLIIWLLSILALGIFVILISPQITKFYDKYTIRQPLWEEYDEENTEPYFALTKIASNLVPGDGYEGTNYFFRNEFSLNGGTTSTEECYQTQYRCGDSGWKDFDSGYILLENRCIVKIKPGTYCNVVLPGGTLISASNDNNELDFANNIFHFYDNDLIFQVISTDDQITVIQIVTKQESVLWHTLAPDFDKKYVVELGDQVIEATGTEFYTSTDEDLGSVTTVIKGSVNVSGTKITKREFAQIPYFDIVSCPPALKACGDSCIPANGICCDSNSYCLSPIQCQENPTSTCKANLFAGNSSQYCCYNTLASSGFSLFDKGSYDCDDGYKFCANRCIPEDQECCYPTDDDCPVSVDDIKVGTGEVPSDYVFPRQYFFTLYDKLLAKSEYIKLVSDSAFVTGTFNFSTVMDYINEYLGSIVEEDYANSDETEQQTIYCDANPNSGACPNTSTSSDDSGTSASSDSDCWFISSIDWCYDAGVTGMGCSSDELQCWYTQKDANGGPNGIHGEGCIPAKCY